MVEAETDSTGLQNVVSMGEFELIANRGAINGMCVARDPREDAAANPNASVPKPRSGGRLRTRRCRQVVIEVVSCSWDLKVVVRPARFALEDPSTKLSMMSFP